MRSGGERHSARGEPRRWWIAAGRTRASRSQYRTELKTATVTNALSVHRGPAFDLDPGVGGQSIRSECAACGFVVREIGAIHSVHRSPFLHVGEKCRAFDHA